jgi:class 3 adenylate cyclase
MADPAPDGLERKLAAILSADVAAYSRLIAADEEGTLRTFRSHREVFEKLVQLHRGRVFNSAGDAILAEFGSAVEAVRCATEIQAALHTRNDQLPEARRVRFRIGVNLGDVVVQGGDLLGDSVNIAARLQGVAAPGGICIAGSVYDQIRNKLSLSFKPLGDLNYKNIPQPVRTFAIAEAEGAGPLPSPARQHLFWQRRPLIAAVLLLAAGSIVWVHSHHQRNALEYPVAAELAARRQALIEQRQMAKAARRLARANSRLADTAPPGAAAASEAAPAPRPPDASNSALPAGTSGAPADPSGLYRGQICYGAGGATEPPRCFAGQAVVLRDRISGEWVGRIPGVKVYLSGEIAQSGEVAIHMQRRASDGSRFAVSDLIGTLRHDRIDAVGSSRDGGNVTLSWSKD